MCFDQTTGLFLGGGIDLARDEETQFSGNMCVTAGICGEGGVGFFSFGVISLNRPE